MVRSEADHILFKHAGESGVRIFDSVKVKEINFEPRKDEPKANGTAKLDRPVSAAWTRKDGNSGTIHFDYVVDASGRAGMVSTKYMKNRSYNQGLKNMAIWGYWKQAGRYGPGVADPIFEAIEGKSCYGPGANLDGLIVPQMEAAGAGIFRCTMVPCQWGSC